MANVMEKVFNITYVGAYILNGIFLIFHLINAVSIITLIIVYGISTIVLFFLGYLIQEHLNNILQLYLIIVGIVTIIAMFFVSGFFPSLWLIMLGGGFIAIAFIFDEFFVKEL